SGNYQFANTPPGQYSVRVTATGYTVSPSSISVTVTADSKRGNNFSATLVMPTINVVQPSAVIAASPSTDVVIAGGPFLSNRQVMFDGTAFPATLTQTAIPVTVVSATGGVSVVMQMQTVAKATIPGGMLAAPRVTFVAVRNIGPGGSVTSPAQSFSVG